MQCWKEKRGHNLRKERRGCDGRGNYGDEEIGKGKKVSRKRSHSSCLPDLAGGVAVVQTGEVQDHDQKGRNFAAVRKSKSGAYDVYNHGKN